MDICIFEYNCSIGLREVDSTWNDRIQMHNIRHTHTFMDYNGTKLISIKNFSFWRPVQTICLVVHAVATPVRPSDWYSIRKVLTSLIKDFNIWSVIWNECGNIKWAPIQIRKGLILATQWVICNNWLGQWLVQMLMVTDIFPEYKRIVSNGCTCNELNRLIKSCC